MRDHCTIAPCGGRSRLRSRWPARRPTAARARAAHRPARALPGAGRGLAAAPTPRSASGGRRALRSRRRRGPRQPPRRGALRLARVHPGAPRRVHGGVGRRPLPRAAHSRRGAPRPAHGRPLRPHRRGGLGLAPRLHRDGRRRRARRRVHPRRRARGAGVAGAARTAWPRARALGGPPAARRCGRCASSSGRAAIAIGAAPWSSGDAFPDGLWVSDWRTQAGRARAALRAPLSGLEAGLRGPDRAGGRLPRRPPRRGLTLVRRQVVNGWHRELRAAVDALLRRARRRTTRARSPSWCPIRRCARGCPAACAPSRRATQRDPDAAARTVVVAATDACRDGRRAPWSLCVERGPRGWRLTGARARATMTLQHD